MVAVTTVLGPVEVDALGMTLMHEHVFVQSPEVMNNYGDSWWDEETRIADAVGKLTELKAAGVDTIVDLTVLGLGRYLPRVQRVNAQVDINIVTATGLYMFDHLPHFFHYRGPETLFGGPELLTEMFLKDIREGIADTGVRAAVLKGAVEEVGITTDQVRVHTAICEAHQETGVPITVHTNSAHQTGRLALEFYAKHDVDLTKVVIGHAGDTNDLDYLRWIMDQGATIGCDRFGLDMFNPTAQRVETIATLVEQGYADRIVLSHDVACYNDFFSGEASQEMLTQTVPNWHFRHVSDDVLPALRAKGVTDEQVTTMMVDNPRRYFTPSAGSGS